MRRAVFALLTLAFAGRAQAQEIVVTGERRAQTLETLAGNTARLSGEELRTIDPQVASEALNRLPGVAIHRNNGVENLPAIRSPVLTGGQSAGSFLVLEDGVPIRAPGFGNVNDLYETSLDFAEAVEVVRGPGSALYGSNAVHGIVNVITPHGENAPEVMSAIEVGSFGRASGSFWAQQHAVGGYGVLGVALDHDGGSRAQSSADQQRLLLGAGGDLAGWRADARLVFQNLNQETAGFIQGEDAYKSSALARTNPTPDAFRDQRLARAQATLTHALGPGELRMTPYARWIDADVLLSFFPRMHWKAQGRAAAGCRVRIIGMRTMRCL